MSVDLCDICHKRPSVIGGHGVHDGVVHSEHSCALCYGKQRGGMSGRDLSRLEGTTDDTPLDPKLDNLWPPPPEFTQPELPIGQISMDPGFIEGAPVTMTKETHPGLFDALRQMEEKTPQTERFNLQDLKPADGLWKPSLPKR